MKSAIPMRPVFDSEPLDPVKSDDEGSGDDEKHGKRKRAVVLKELSTDNGVLNGFVDDAAFRKKPLYKPTGRAGDIIEEDEDFGGKWLEEFTNNIKEFKKVDMVKFLDIVSGASGTDSNPLSDANVNTLIKRVSEYTDIAQSQYQDSTRKKSKDKERDEERGFRLVQNPGGKEGRNILTGMDVAKAYSATPFGSKVPPKKSESKSRVVQRGPVRKPTEQLDNLVSVLAGNTNAANAAARKESQPAAEMLPDDESDYGGSEEEGDNGSNKGQQNDKKKDITVPGIQSVIPVLKPGLYGLSSLQDASRKGKHAFLTWLLGTGEITPQTLELVKMMYPQEGQSVQIISTLPFISHFFLIDTTVMAAMIVIKNNVLKLIQMKNQLYLQKCITEDGLIKYYMQEYGLAVGCIVALNKQGIYSITMASRLDFNKNARKYSAIIANDLIMTDRINEKISSSEQSVWQITQSSDLCISETRLQLQREIDYYA
jgi:hypothetical protein